MNNIEKFVELLYEGVRAWEKAGKMLVNMTKRNPKVKEKILREHPEISSSILAKLEAVGRGIMKPELLLSDATPYRLARDLPVSDQERLLEDSQIPLVVEKDGSFDVIHADFRHLNSKQSKQVFSKDHIRSEAEQRAYLEASRKTPPKKDWEMVDGMVVFRKGAKMTVSQLSSIIEAVAVHRSEAA